MNFEEQIHVNTEYSEVNNAPKRTPTGNLLLLCAAYILLTLYIPAALFSDIGTTTLQILSVASAVVSIFAFSRMSKKPRSAISYALTLALCFALLGVLMCGIAASFVGSVLILAYLLITLKSPALRLAALLPALISYLAAAAILGSFALSAAALLHLPAALLLAYSFGHGQSRISVICKTSAGIILSLAAVVLAVFVMRYGTDFSVLPRVVESARNYATDILSRIIFAVYSELGEISMTDSLALASAAINATFNLLPALVVVMANIVSFFIQSMMINIFIHGETDKEKIRAMTLFDMSLISAIVFLTAFLLSAISSEDTLSVWSVTAENVALILMPGLVLTAILALRRFTFGKKGSCGGVLIYFVIIFLMFNLPSIMLTLASISGAVIIILNNLTLMLSNKKNKRS